MRQSILYDAWGNERDRIGVSANNFTFTGHELDEETGLIYAKARFYDPDIGRFLTQDSFLGDASNAPSLHRYFYANANPLRFTDPTGNYSIDELKSDLEWWGNFATAAATDLRDNAGERWIGVQRATISAAAVIVTEPVNQVIDVSVLTYNALGYEGLEDYELRSAIGRRQLDRVAAGQGAFEASVKGVTEIAAAVATFGISAQVQAQYEAYDALASGEYTIEDYEQALIANAGGAVAAVAIASAASRATGGGWLGPKASLPKVSISFGELRFPSFAPEPAFAGARVSGAGTTIHIPTGVALTGGSGLGPASFAMANTTGSGGSGGSKKKTRYRRKIGERKKALLRDADDPNSGLTDEQRAFIKKHNGERVPEGMEVSHEEPLYTKPPNQRGALDTADNMKTQPKPDHRARHQRGGEQYEKFGPPSDYPWNRRKR